MKYNPALHHRHTIRLKEYDYSQEGLYFVTICCQDMICRFGKIENGDMILNDAGKIVYEEWENSAGIRKEIEIHEYVVMPNHFHAIVEIVGAYGIRPNDNGIRPDNNADDKGLSQKSKTYNFIAPTIRSDGGEIVKNALLRQPPTVAVENIGGVGAWV